ncbi:MAG: Stf0 family sulfotransferase [Paracoccaceae bacterium]
MTAKTYIICTNIRSGSNLLCRSLSKQIGFGNPTELFHPDLMNTHFPDAKKLQNYLDATKSASLSDHGIFGTKLHWYQFQDLLSIARNDTSQTDIQLLDTLFPNAKFVFLYRENTAAQAVSALTASQTDMWEIASCDRRTVAANPPSPSLLNVARVRYWERFLIGQTMAWTKFFADNQIPYHKISYEKLTSNFELEMLNTMRFLAPGKSINSTRILMPTRPGNAQPQKTLLKYYNRQPGVLTSILGGGLAAVLSLKKWARQKLK